ncbi:HlyD family efflux transporter periplasmic adaptor subunit [uncultured Sulfitobacter sp.]|uniref:HlyD family secretion protein n=1 Tax=uncultured Sulfitobacter sp. TaxID=191468 RepID=UPI0026215989|nr:HlyD family efflux transporter periplasmic adaptor subunit [uncultured Sulfitobacter sp.]
MNIRHECPLPDLSFSVTAPLSVTKANGRKFVAQRWSLAGLWCDEDAGDMTGDVFLSVPFQGVDVSFQVTLTSTDMPGFFAFQDLTVRQRETLGLFHQSLLAGRMVSAGEMITALDTPVDLVPMGETEEEQIVGEAKAKPRGARILWNAVSYVLIALFLVTFLGTQIWQRLSYIALDHGRFIAPVVAYEAPQAGYVGKVAVAVGDQVKAGDILVRLEDPDRQSDVEEVRAEILLAEQQLRMAQDRLARHIARRAAEKAALQRAFDVLWGPWQHNDPHLQTYPAEIEAARLTLYNFDRGRDAEALMHLDMVQTLQDAAHQRELELRRWKRELRHRKAAADELVVRAKSNGTVHHLHTVKGSYVARGALVVEVEDNAPRLAMGWVDDDLAASVFVGMQAEVAFMHRGQSKRMLGVVSDLQAGTHTAQPDRFGLVVTIKAQDTGVKNSRKWFRRNAPAQLRLKRDMFAGWFGGADESP